MLRIFLPLVFVFIYLGWIIYLLVSKKKWKQEKEGLIIGLFFFFVWGIIYYFIEKN